MVRAKQIREWVKPSALVVLVAYVSVIVSVVYGIATVAQNDARKAAHAIEAVATLPLMGEPLSTDTTPRVLRSMGSKEETAPVKIETDAFAHARPAPAVFERLSSEEIAELKDEATERIVTDDASPWHDGETKTYKTMCVRLCDGAYFPISFATTRNNFAKDEAQCAARCGSPARLFAFPNPGGKPEAMRDRSGHSYVSLPTAFQYRHGPVAGCSCKAEPWEAASRDRHRLYALEASLAAGKSVDTAELNSLRTKLADATASRVPPSGSNGHPATTASLPSNIMPAEEAEEGANSDHVTTAESQEPNKARALVGPKIVEEYAPSPKLLQSMPPEHEIAALETVEQPKNQNSSSAPKLEATKLVEATLEPLPKKTIRPGTKRRTPKQPVIEEPAETVAPEIWIPRGLAQQAIWGIGPNAYGAPRGTSARDTFARNFY